MSGRCRAGSGTSGNPARFARPRARRPRARVAAVGKRGRGPRARAGGFLGGGEGPREGTNGAGVFGEGSREGEMAQVETQQGFPGAQYGYPPVKKDEDGNEIDCTWTGARGTRGVRAIRRPTLDPPAPAPAAARRPQLEEKALT